MVQKIRLYRMHDLDLYLLYFTHNFMFYDATKEALRMYAAGDNGYISTPETLDPLPDMTSKGIIQLFLRLKDDKDADIINLINSVEPGLRNMFIKMTLRKYLKDLDRKVYPNTEKGWKYKNVDSVSRSPGNKNMSDDKKSDELVKEKKPVTPSSVKQTRPAPWRTKMDEEEPSESLEDEEDIAISDSTEESSDLFDMISQMSY